MQTSTLDALVIDCHSNAALKTTTNPPWHTTLNLLLTYFWSIGGQLGSLAGLNWAHTHNGVGQLSARATVVIQHCSMSLSSFILQQKSSASSRGDSEAQQQANPTRLSWFSACIWLTIACAGVGHITCPQWESPAKNTGKGVGIGGGEELGPLLQSVAQANEAF